MIIGITGCVGAGKSTAAAILAAWGFASLDVDHVAAETARALGHDPGAVLREILADGPGRAALEASIIPEVRRRVAAWCARAPAAGVIDAALLFEHGLDELCDLTICLRCPEAERRRRVEARATTSASAFDRIDRAQLPEAEKARRATHAVWTNGSRADLEQALRIIALRAPAGDP